MHVLYLKPWYEFTPLVPVGAAVLAWRFKIWQMITGRRAPGAMTWAALGLLSVGWGLMTVQFWWPKDFPIDVALGEAAGAVLLLAGVATFLLDDAPAGYRPRPSEWWAGIALLGLNWALLSSGVVLGSPWLGMISFWELLAAVALLAGGWPVLRAAAPALIFLLLIVPPPMNLDGKLVLTLQDKTSWFASHILDRMGVLHFRDGNAFDVGGRQFFVDRACSGINSLFSTTAVVLFCVLFFGCHWLRTFLLFLAVVFWVMVANITRVTLIAWLDTKFGIDLTKDGWDWSKRCFFQHTILGFVLFAAILGLMYSTNRFLMFLATTVRWGKAEAFVDDEPLIPAGDQPQWSMSWSLLAPVICAYGIVALFQLGEMQLGAAVSESKVVKSFNTWTVEDMPERIGPWERQKDSTFDSRDSDNPFGAHSRTWQYKFVGTGLTGIISFDYPFPEWHDLRGCYKGIGWTEEKSDSFAPKDGRARVWNVFGSKSPSNSRNAGTGGSPNSTRRASRSRSMCRV